ncbi:hypothetical protein FOPE_12643 [Fonsecaea pedrosoi]|nr:hypothetical protein FOPE_12643 [Fonsecaea pedrosoi]
MYLIDPKGLIPRSGHRPRQATYHHHHNKTKTTDDGALQISSPKSDETSGQPAQSLPKDQDDQDLHRADELVSLYYDVKVKFTERGPDPDFVQAAREVDQVLAALSRSDR